MSFMKRLGGFLGVELRSVGITFTDGLCDLGGGITLAEGLHDWGRRVPFELYPGICLKTEEKHGKPQ
jgi:hypothetical protein